MGVWKNLEETCRLQEPTAFAIFSTIKGPLSRRVCKRYSAIQASSWDISQNHLTVGIERKGGSEDLTSGIIWNYVEQFTEPVNPVDKNMTRESKSLTGHNNSLIIHSNSVFSVWNTTRRHLIQNVMRRRGQQTLVHTKNKTSRKTKQQLDKLTIYA